MASFTADPPAPSAPRTPPEVAIPESPIPDFPGPASASAIPTPGLKPVAPPPDLGRRIRARSWALVLDAFANATGAARRAPGMASSRGLAVLRKLAIIDPARVLGLAKAARALAPRSAFVTETEAMMTARALGWDAAAPLFAGLRPEARNGAAAALLRHRPAPAIWPALPAAHRPAALTEAEARSLVIYTVAFGEGPEPAPLFYGVPGLRFLCLTDRTDLAIAGWETVAPPASPGTPADPAAAAAWARILPHRALAGAAPGARASLFLAPDRKLVGNAHTLMLRWLLPHDLVFWRSEAGIDWQDLAEAHLIGAAPEPDATRAAVPAARVLAQARACAARGLPRDLGACDTGMIWRRHDVPEVAALMEDWWAAETRAPGLEAISLYAAVNDRASRTDPEARRRLTRVLPAALGPAANNAFVAATTPRPPRRLAFPNGPRAAVTRVVGRPLPVTFVYADKYAAAASTILRGKQLSELVAARYPDEIEMAYQSGTADLDGRVVILTKGAIEMHSAGEIAELARRNLAVIGSWDDMLPEPDKMAAMDATMAVSNRQAHDFGRLFPGTPSYHVTHHVNSQVRPMTPPTDRLRAAYFGYPTNTYRPDSLGHLVDFVGLDTSKVEMNWLDLLPAYNCHWIVRRSKPHDGWKPFLKGFVAARCGAVLAVGRKDEDAVQYLGDDYPFYVRGPDPKLLEYDMMALAAAFGGPDWRRAKDIMAQVAARSTDAQVCAEFRAMIEDVIR